MKYTLTVQSEDYAFIKEAIKLRALILTEALEKQVILQVAQEIRHPEHPLAAAPVMREGAPVSIVKRAVKKKLHWTQTPEGKKTMSARKRKGTK